RGISMKARDFSQRHSTCTKKSRTLRLPFQNRLVLPQPTGSEGGPDGRNNPPGWWTKTRTRPARGLTALASAAGVGKEEPGGSASRVVGAGTVVPLLRSFLIGPALPS